MRLHAECYALLSFKIIQTFSALKMVFKMKYLCSKSWNYGTAYAREMEHIIIQDSKDFIRGI